MLKKIIAGVLLSILFIPGIASAVNEEDFEIQTTKNLLNLCTAPPGNSLYYQAINFCHGFLVGAYHYHIAQAKGPKGVKMVCLPDPPPSRNDAIDMFIQWTKDRPQYWNEEAVETEFRFLIEKWPCQ
jgi:hypothetical protein